MRGCLSSVPKSADRDATYGTMTHMTAIPVDAVLDLVPENGVIALGEPTHGSANAFAQKMTLILELARRGVLSTFAFEESYALGLRVDDALRNGCDLDPAWSRATLLWRTPTILDGLHQLQALNSSLPKERRIAFLGIDIRKPHLAAATLREQGHDDPLLRALAEQGVLSEADRADLPPLCLQIEEAGDPTAGALARQILRWSEAYRDAPDLPDLHLRDPFMAATLLEQRPSAGLTVVWAHNEHVAMNPDFYGGPAMGAVLAQQISTDYAAIGFLCGGGECRAVDPSTGDDEYRAVPLPPVSPESTEAALAERGAGFSLTADFAHPGPRRFLGWKVDSSQFESGRNDFDLHRPASDFTAIVYLPRSVADTAWTPTRDSQGLTTSGQPSSSPSSPSSLSSLSS